MRRKNPTSPLPFLLLGVAAIAYFASSRGAGASSGGTAPGGAATDETEPDDAPPTPSPGAQPKFFLVRRPAYKAAYLVGLPAPDPYEVDEEGHPTLDYGP